VDIAALLEAVDVCDMRVVERREDPCLALEAGKTVGVQKRVGSTLIATSRPSLGSLAR
jgi:hypothetical protein